MSTNRSIGRTASTSKKTVPPTCVPSPLPMAASAALRAAPATCISVTSTPKGSSILAAKQAGKDISTFFSRIC